MPYDPETGALEIYKDTPKPQKPAPPKFREKPERDRPSPAPSYIKRPEKR